MKAFVFLFFLSLDKVYCDDYLGDKDLLPILRVPSMDLFTGIGYVLLHPTQPDKYVQWINVSQEFAFVPIQSPPNMSSIFYLTHYNARQYHLRVASLPDKLVTIKYNKTNGPTSGLLTLFDARTDTSTTQYLYDFVRSFAATIPVYYDNVYRLDTIKPVNNVTYELGAIDTTSLWFRFVILITLESQITSVNLTSKPMEMPVDFTFNPAEKIRQQSIWNPTGLSMEKTFDTTEEVTSWTMLTLDISESEARRAKIKETTNETPGFSPYASSPKNVVKTIATSPQEGLPDNITVNFKGNQSVTSKTTTNYVSEKIIIPAYTCAEVYIVTNETKTIYQRLTAYLRISGKVRRFTKSYMSRERRFAPGMVVEEDLRIKNFTGTFLEAKETFALYEVLGELKNNKGTHTSVIAEEVRCPGSNQRPQV